MPTSVDDRLHFMTTLILSTWSSNQGSASGFFYHVFPDRTSEHQKKSKAGQVLVALKELWLVTNRHVLVNDKNELAQSITFFQRKTTEKGFEWFPITISGSELHARCRFHQSEDVDVAAVSVLDLIADNTKSDSDKDELSPVALQTVSNKMFPNASKITMSAGDDVLIVGYPRGFYDDVSKFPIVKSGVIASKWGAPFGGNPYFLIDAKLFPGSSGSIVISRPSDIMIENKQIYFSTSGSKEFAFLGIFSGEPFLKSRPIETDNFMIISKEGYDVGIVWYYHLIPTIISEGNMHSKT